MSNNKAIFGTLTARMKARNFTYSLSKQALKVNPLFFGNALETNAPGLFFFA
jgi:hypothetical protein